MEKFKLEIAGRDLIVEIKDWVGQANGSVLVRYGDTVVLATAVMSKQGREGIDFFPLTVEYEERFYAAGKILGSRFLRRESRPSDEAILTGRAIDRAIRPLFPQDLRKEIQVVVTCLSWDSQNDSDIIGLLAASLALSISDIPWAGPVSHLRLGRAEDNFILNPTYEEREKGSFDLLFAGIANPKKNGDFLINMIEMEAAEAEEDVVFAAYQFAKPYLEKLIEFQKEIIKKIGKEKIKLAGPQINTDLEKEIKDFLGDKLEKALYLKDKTARQNALEELKEQLCSSLGEPDKIKYAKEFFEKEIERTMDLNILKSEKRPDGRKLDELRNISVEVGLLPRTHGTGLFMRGETKALSILTLGAPSDVKLLEGMEIRGKKRFMHHYNFPPYSTGEVKPMRGPGRREIGHGMLAEKALFPLVPSFDEFPYTMRVVTEILSSNGSSSMASVSAASLALMDAGVPLKNPVAGIAMGLVIDDNDNYKVLTDIQGPEDHYGDMDFKVAGTKKGITAIQMDVKTAGINEDILKEALAGAKKARNQILDTMAKTIEKPRPELSQWAPRIVALQINPEKIREVIGPGGKIINEIIDQCSVAIDIEDTGKIFITGEKKESVAKAVEWINNITREVKAGETFTGKVRRILDFGAFVEILPGQEGMIHISQLANRRVARVEDVVKVGDIVKVKVIAIDEQGRINLSLKDAN